MGNRNPNSTNYVHADEPNILNIHKAMDYNGQGKPTLRTSVTTLASEGNPSGASAFGEPVSVPIMPVIQLDALYGFQST